MNRPRNRWFVFWLPAACLAAALVAQEPAEPPVEPAPGETAAGETAAGENEPASGDSEAVAGDESSPAELPGPKIPRRLSELRPLEEEPEVEVTFSSDASCRLRIDGEEIGELAADEPAQFSLRAGQHLVRAVSVEYPLADFRRTVRIRPEGEPKVQIKLQRQIDDLHRRERREQIYRDEDPPTPLMWNRRDNGANVRWNQAEEYCSELLLGGYEDWRLPTLVELKSIQALWSAAPIKAIGAFSLTGCCPWSADREGDQRAWNFNFRYRKPFLGNVAYSLDLRALCVREWDLEADPVRKSAENDENEEPAPADRDGEDSSSP